ncbi:ribosomal protein L35 [Enterococcus sp. 9E7_DIV0242]|uniref:Ribosomal protein L35 n=1 Tax=Candidatus Enterococcus clewellii TaxID=1834193 RepID=A0A242K712_9ENTE|nr:ribosomal protein L35 [Enterococcus sp. 9E7_DIV0242]
MPKMKSHSGLNKRVKSTKKGKVKRHKKGVKTAVYVSHSDLPVIKKSM